MDLDFRPIEPEDAERYFRAVERAFTNVPTEEEVRLELSLLEPARTIAVFDGSDIVGSTAAYSMELTIPGGVVPMAGVTLVGVVPTHRRRGILTELMRRQLSELRDRGELLAGLWATEGAIYQRFGYGLATLRGRFAIDRARTDFVRPLPDDPGRVRLVSRDEALPAMTRIYERIRPDVPGMLARTPAWWEAVFSDMESRREGASPLFYVLHETAGSVDGYAAYRGKDAWTDGVASGEAVVHELMAPDPAVYASLWRFMFGIDLVAKVSAWCRPSDEPLLSMLAEPRRLRFELQDALWLRLVDVPGALATRRYAAADRLVLAVRDDFCPWNEGAVELTAGPDGAEVRPGESAEPDLHVDAADLGAVYLGGTTFDQLARAGRVTATSGGALRRADALFATPRAPWCPHIF
jgi:predicted acetyltransferase